MLYSDILNKKLIEPSKELQVNIQEEIYDFNAQLKDYLPEDYDIQIEEANIDKFAGIISIYKKENSQIKFPLFYLAVENNYYILSSQYLSEPFFIIPFLYVSGQRKIKNKKDLQKALIHIIKSPEFMRLLRGLEI